MSSAKKVMLKGSGIKKERKAAAAITPGHLVEVASAGTVQVHSTAGGLAQKAFALVDVEQGNTITDAYATGARVQYMVVERGAEINALIADGEAIAIGDKLVSAGDGTLKELTSESTDESVVAIAIEACDMSGSSGADPSPRCAVEVM